LIPAGILKEKPATQCVRGFYEREMMIIDGGLLVDELSNSYNIFDGGYVNQSYRLCFKGQKNIYEDR